MRVITSAPSKVILFGEHAVVYGEPAIASALDIRTKAYVEDSDETIIEAFSEGRKIDDLEPIKAMIEAAKEMFGFDGLRIRIESDVPMGSGMGSSASSSVAVAAGISKIFKGEIDLETVVRLADVAEKVAHGKPSGIDTRIVAYGGTMLYIREKEPKFYQGLSGTITIADTGIPRSTRDLVLGVKSLKERITPVNDVIKSIGNLVSRTWERILSGSSLEDLREEAWINHGLLRSIGVSHPALDKLVWIARRHTYGAKLTGAGGGGSAIGFGDLSDLWKVPLEEVGMEYNTSPRMIVTSVGAEGVRIEGRFCLAKI